MRDYQGTIRERYEVDWNNDDQIVDFVSSRWSAKDYYKGDLENKWLKILATYEGFPYLDFDETRKILVDQLEVPEWRVNLVINLLLPKIRTIVAKHLRNRPIWDVLPATMDVADINKALKSKKTLQGFWYGQEVDYDFINLLLWLGLTGNAFAYISWNPNIGPEYELSLNDFIDQNLIGRLQNSPIGGAEKQQILLADAQQKFQQFVQQNGGTNLPLGEVEIDIPTPFDMLFPTECKFKKIPWLIRGQVREISYYADMGVDPKIFSAPTEKEARYIYYCRRNYNLFNMGFSKALNPNQTRDVLELQLWMPKSPQFRSGFHAVIAGGKVLFKGPNPYKHGEIPYVHFTAEQTPGKILGFSAAEMAIPIINEYQKTKSQMTEIKNLMAKPKWLAPRIAKLDDTAITSEPGEVIEYSGGIPPTQVAPVPIPAYMPRLMETDRRDVDDIMAIHDASIGINPSGSRSGLMNMNLQEQDDGQWAIVGLKIDTGLSKIGRLVLSVQDQFYKEDRLIKYVGERNRYELFTLKQGDLTSQTKIIGADYFNVRVTQFSQFGLSRGGQLEYLKILLQYQIFKDSDRAKIMKFINMGWMEDQLDEFQVDRSNAHKENLQVSQGQPIQVDFSDNDDVHIEEHVLFQKGDEYKVLPPPIRTILQDHVQSHKLYKITKMVEPQVLTMPAQIMAMALNKINPGVMNNAGRNDKSESGSEPKSGSNNQ